MLATVWVKLVEDAQSLQGQRAAAERQDRASCQLGVVGRVVVQRQRAGIDGSCAAKAVGAA